MKIAIASTKEGYIFEGHFAHAPIYRIYLYEGGGQLKLVEERKNPLGDVPDVDVEPHGGHMHGPAKYAWLRERVLPDVDAIIAAGACQTSHNYFSSQGVKMLYVDPIQVELLEKYIKENPADFENILNST